MLPAPSIRQIRERLAGIDLDPWGPDGVRYICILFWDDLGYRMLHHQFDSDTWMRWSRSSGDFWDLFLAGCFRYASPGHYGDRAQAIGVQDQSRYSSPFLWSAGKAQRLADAVAGCALEAGTPRPWQFSGPIELVAVGARRDEDEIEIDWAGLRAAKITAHQLGDAVAYYTEAHIMADADLVPSSLPSPGDFDNDLPRELLRDLRERIGVIGTLFRNIVGT